MANVFDYDQAFSRNIGWITDSEQRILRNKRVAIAGLGGVGGRHFITLTRLGIGSFTLADFDVFDLVNFNRQKGSGIEVIGKPKLDVLSHMALDINPELDIRRFPEGINGDNVEEFLKDADIYVDGLDFFAFQARSDVFAACHRLGIPAITAAPLGMSVALLNFLPGGMSFEEYFRWQGCDETEMGFRFLMGLAPAGLHRDYLVDPSRIDLKNHRGPSTSMGCELCAGTAASQALKILLGRGKIYSAPHGLQYDAFEDRLKHTWLPGGNNNPLQRLKLGLARKIFLSQVRKPESSGNESPQTLVEKILDAARWAPSGDNTQPWRFEILGDQDFVVHGFDTREHCVYDLDGHPSQIALGALLQNIELAAAEYGHGVEFKRRLDAPEEKPTIDVQLRTDPSLHRSPLFPYIPVRATQRGKLSPKALTAREKRELEDSIAPGYRVIWVEGWAGKLKAANLMFQNANVRLTMPEAYEVHKSIIEWNARYSYDKLPDQAIGLDPIATRMMKWTITSWAKVDFFNTYLAGTLLPRIEMDWLPGMFCGAHFLLVADREPRDTDDYIEAGKAMQRFWLTATKLGLHCQPEMTPLIFGRYIREGRPFTRVEKVRASAARLATKFRQLFGEENADRVVFVGRTGHGPAAKSRSLRLDIEKLRVRPPS